LWPRLEHSRPCCKLPGLHLHRCRGNSGSLVIGTSKSAVPGENKIQNGKEKEEQEKEKEKEMEEEMEE
jgi:hypothetical protein